MIESYESLRREYHKARDAFYRYVRLHHHKMDWQEYMQSPEWQRLRSEALRRDKYVCQLCGESKNLHVHHISYEHVGTAREIDDVVSLCARCHDEVHAAHGEEAGRRYQMAVDVPIGRGKPSRLSMPP